MKVTIALATYNVALYLRETLERIVNQTLVELEILCIDDASTDGTVDILKEYAKSDSRFRLILKTKNEGLSVSRNTSLELATGDYVCFVDGDDLMDLDLMEKAYSLAVSDNADVVIWDYYEFGEQLFNFISKDRPSSLIDISPTDRHALVKCLSFTWIRLFKTESLRKLRVHFPEGLIKQDQPIHWLTTTCLGKISLLPERKYAYRISRTQTSFRRGLVLLDIVYVLDYTERILKEHNVFEEYKRDFIHSQLDLWYGLYNNISSEFSDKVLNEISQRYTPMHSDALKNESFIVKSFYKGYIERISLMRFLYEFIRYVQKGFQNLNKVE